MLRVCSWALFFSVTLFIELGSMHAESADQSLGVEREVKFELTFSNSDLIWLGDPASPNALIYLKMGAKPIATDLCVTTLTQNTQSPARRYMREARVATVEGRKTVYAFTKNSERVIGTIDEKNRFVPNEFYINHHDHLSTWPIDASLLSFDEKQNALYYTVDVTGPVLDETLDFLPLAIKDSAGNPVAGSYAIEVSSAEVKTPVVSLVLKSSGKSIVIAQGAMPTVTRRQDANLESYDNKTGTYLLESAYRAGVEKQEDEPSVTFTFPGEFSKSIKDDGPSLVLLEQTNQSTSADQVASAVKIDGHFEDWRNVSGVDDPRGDIVPYLDYVPDVDLLEFKVAHDDSHIYFYARVAGKVGRTHHNDGRSYFYAYMDVDQNPGTGFLPSRDDDCYFGVEIGDDCEVQFEFVNNAFRKTFYGFCGLGGDSHVLKQQVTLGKSQYGRLDDKGQEREHYKAEYTYRKGVAEITEDLKLGTSDTITLAVSPDGSEVEVVSTYSGFLKDPNGKPTVSTGQTIDVAAGMESDSKVYFGKTRWGADSTLPIRGYKLTPSSRSKQ